MLRCNRVNKAAPSAWLLSRVRWRRRSNWRLRCGLPLTYPDRRGLPYWVRVATPPGTCTAVDRVANRGHSKECALLHDRVALNRAFAMDRALLPARRPSGGAVLIRR
jgi:hypothetical protein